jgi:hypothetical protein
MQTREISIWFFIGMSLVLNGALICAAGIYEYKHPPVDKVVLFDMHAAIWWGGILFVTGLLYCLKFSPNRAASK